MPITPEEQAIQDRMDTTEFDSSFAESQAAEDSPETPAAVYQSFTSALGQKIYDLFTLAERNRLLIEERWLKDLRQYRGEYDPTVLAKMHPKRSKAFLSLTRTKVKTVTARQMDILFPANGDKNWGVEPSPIPELDPVTMQSILEQMTAATGQPPSEDEIKKTINDEAQRRSDNMEMEMADQLSELKYREIIGNVIRSGNLYGTGVMKGPLVREQISKRWLPDQKGGWVTLELKKLLPYCEFVPLWDLYPDMTARKPEDMRYIFQRYVMTPNQLYKISKRKDFNGDAIAAYMRAHPGGDASFKNHEESLRNMASGAELTMTIKEQGSTVGLYSSPSSAVSTGKYEVREYWGYMSAQELIDIGVKVPADRIGLEVAANIWTLGTMIIKAILSPIEGVEFPYFFYHYDKDETSIFGEGIPFIMRDSQELFNAAIRAMLDNAAISAGPIIEANIDLLAPGEDPTDIYPFRVFQRTGQGIEASTPAITVTNLKSYTSEFLVMVKFFLETADEITTVPRFMHGDQTRLQGAGKTATGLSMLMGAANITIKDQIKYFDDGITNPFIKALYFWNMDYNPKESIKGDFGVVCKGTASLIAKEVIAEKLMQFLAMTNNEIDMMYMNRDVALREMAKIMDLSSVGLIKTKDQVKIMEQERSVRAEQDRQFAMEMTRIKAQSGGHMQGASSGTRPQMEGLSQDQLEGGQIPEVSVNAAA